MASALRVSLVVIVFAVVAAPATPGVVGNAELTSPAAGSATPGKFKNCKALNRRYAHGVGRVGARDKTKSGDPVTNFRRSNRLYRLNQHLDRDNDKIACEKH